MKSKKTNHAPGRGIGWFNTVCGTLLIAAAIPIKSEEHVTLMLAAGVLSLVLGMGLLHRRPWARVTALGCYALNLASAIASFNPIAVAVSFAVLTRLCSAPVEAAFSEGIQHTVAQPAFAAHDFEKQRLVQTTGSPNAVGLRLKDSLAA
jgi:hypothetical protein